MVRALGRARLKRLIANFAWLFAALLLVLEALSPLAGVFARPCQCAWLVQIDGCRLGISAWITARRGFLEDWTEGQDLVRFGDSGSMACSTEHCYRVGWFVVGTRARADE